MDPLTHALSGALVARATAPKHTDGNSLPLRLRIAAGFGAALFPDLDFALRLLDTITYLNQHQGITHSIALLPLWTVLLSGLFATLAGRPRDWLRFIGPVTLGLVAHILGDLITAYGLMLFAPFSAQRFSLPLAFVIDPWITLVIATGLLISWWRPARGGASLTALVLLGAYIGFLAYQHKAALAAAHAYAKHLQHEATEIDVLPQPFSPFNWKLIVHEGDDYHVAHVNLRRLSGTDAPIRLPGVAGDIAGAYGDGSPATWRTVARFGNADTETTFARDAWRQPAFRAFREFARLPRLVGITDDAHGQCAWFIDMRFELPALDPSFRFGVCLQADDTDDWRMVRSRGRFWID